MRHIKIIAAIVLPLIVGAMFATTSYTFADAMGMIEPGLNYTPLFVLIAAAAAFFMAYATIITLFPVPQLAEIGEPAQPSPLQPCIFTVSDINKSYGFLQIAQNQYY